MNFKDMDPDDRLGYLQDYVTSWAHARGIDSEVSFYEHFQEDNFPDDVANVIENVLEACGVFNK